MRALERLTAAGHTGPAKPMTEDPALAVLATLDALGIAYERHEHPPVFTVEEAVTHWAAIEATHCKNLFLRNKKASRHYLVVAEHTTPVNLNQLAGRLGDDRLSFASPERLARFLGLTPGSVSPFGLINDTRHEVQVVLDAALGTVSRVAFHPNVNTATIVLARADFDRFLAWCGNPVRVVAL